MGREKHLCEDQSNSYLVCYQYSDSVLSGKEKQLWQVEKWDFGDCFFPTFGKSVKSSGVKKSENETSSFPT